MAVKHLAAAIVLCAFIVSKAEPDVTAEKADVFGAVDVNKDGIIDRTEFATLEKNDKAGWLSTLAGTAKTAAKTVKGFTTAAWGSLSMIIATEIGDRTFCIAAVMAMRYARLTVFAGAIGALAVMTLLSASIGVVLPSLLPHYYTHYAAGALFGFFGVKLLQEASSMSGGGGVAEELAETEQELGITAEKGTEGSSSPSASGDGSGRPTGDASSGPGSNGIPDGAAAPFMGGAEEPKSELAKVRARATASNSTGGFLGSAAGALGVGAAAAADGGVLSTLASEWPVFSQAFTLTFLAEWGDRSQIATIAMAAAQDPFGVCFGGVIGHSLCTGLAVLGGRLLASRISEKAVAIGGGVLFMLFAIHAFIVGPGEEPA